MIIMFTGLLFIGQFLVPTHSCYRQAGIRRW